jgi:plasmid stabilization system protein ParE
MSIRYTPRSFGDLQAIHSYIAQHNPPAADRVVGVIERRVDSLRQSPRLGYPSDDSTIRILLAIPYPYRIYYRIAADEIEIIHIRHMARRPPTAGDL